MPGRRAFLGSLFLLGAARLLAQPRFRDNPFSLGVASGYPHPGGFVLWTRLAGNLDPVAIPVRWEVADDEAMRKTVASGTVEAHPDWAHSVHVEPRGLEADRWYYYRFFAGDAVSPIGRTRTAPAPNATAPHLRFAFASCQHYEHGYFSAYRHMVADDLDLVVFLGDYIYESSLQRNRVRTHERQDEPVTLEEYRARHALYKTDENLRWAHGAFPWIATWDDHEVDNDYANDRQEDGAPPAEFLLRRAAAYRAYYEHMPLPAAMRPNGPDMRIYATLGWGSLANFHLLDGRQYRSPQACPRKVSGGNDVDPSACTPLRDPARTMLGAAQESWLDRQFRASRSAWNIVAQQTVMGQLDTRIGDGKRIWTDNWDGYPLARRRLLESIAARRLANPVVIGGDVHLNIVSDLKLDFDDPESPVVASELVGTSITSPPGSWQKNLPQIVAENPHVRYARSDRRGYVRAGIAGGRLTAELVGLDTVKQPRSRAEVLARFVVEDGRPGPQQA